MDPENKPQGPSPHYSLYQREIFKRGGETGERMSIIPSASASWHHPSLTSLPDAVPTFSVHPEELQESTKKKLSDRGYFYANSNAGLGWTERANREAFYRWRIVPRALVDTNVRDLTSVFCRCIAPCWARWLMLGCSDGFRA